MRAAAVVSLSGVLAACSPSPPSTITDDGTAESAGGADNDLAADLTGAMSWESANDKAAVDFAYSEGFRRCMSERGFEFDAARPEAELVDPYARRWGVTSIDEAEEYGFAGPPSAASPSEAPDLAYYNSLSDSARREFEEAAFGPQGTITSMSFEVSPGTAPQEVSFGFSEDSCHAAAATSTYGSVDAYFRYEAYRGAMVAALQDADVQASATTQFQAALERWRECVRAAGFTTTDPIALADQHASDPTSSQAREAATADATCKQQSRLLAEWNAALAAAARSEQERLLPVIDEFTRLRAEVIARATS